MSLNMFLCIVTLLQPHDGNDSSIEKGDRVFAKGVFLEKGDEILLRPIILDVNVYSWALGVEMPRGLSLNSSVVSKL